MIPKERRLTRLYQERIQRILAYLQKQGIDAALITLPKHVYYLTGFLTEPHERFMGLVIPAAGEPSLIVPALDREAAAEASGIKQILTHTDTDNPYEVLKQALPSGLNKLGLEKAI